MEKNAKTLALWRVSWEDTADAGFKEEMTGTKYLRYMANVVGADSPDKVWLYTKDLYWRCKVHFGAPSIESVERNCRSAIKAAGVKATVSATVNELAMLAWERREREGIPDADWNDWVYPF